MSLILVHDDRQELVSFSCIWIVSFSSIIYRKDYPFSSECSFFLCCKSILYTYIGLFLDSLFCSISLRICFYDSTMWYVLKSGIIMPSSWFFFCSELLWLFRVFCSSKQILKAFFFYFCEECNWYCNRNRTELVDHFG